MFFRLGVGVLTLAATTLCACAGECPGNPDALGTSRVLAVDPAKYPQVGTVDYETDLPLDDHEVVLTFDDGPLPPYTARVLDALKAECVKANFFIVGSMARYAPQLVKRAYDEGHTIGTHTQDHKYLAHISLARAKKQIDDGIASTAAAIGDPKAVAPFFRFPYLDYNKNVEAYVRSKGMMIWSIDSAASDWSHITPARVLQNALNGLEEEHKGIVLLHDIQPRTAAMLPEFLRELKRRGYRVVHVIPASAEQPKTAAAPAQKPTPAPDLLPAGTPPGRRAPQAYK